MLGRIRGDRRTNSRSILARSDSGLFQKDAEKLAFERELVDPDRMRRALRKASLARVFLFIDIAGLRLAGI